MKNILYITPDLKVKGGITTVLNGYIQSSLNYEFNLHFISSHRDGSKGYKLFIAVLGLLMTVFKLASMQIDIVHFHCGDLPSPIRKYFYYRLVRLFNTKIILHFHGASFINQYQKLSHGWKKRLKAFFSEVDLFICLSKIWEAQIKEIAPKANTIVIQNAIPIPRQLSHHVSSEKSLRLAFLGRIGQRKGLFDLLKVLADIKGQGHDILLEVGGNGDVDSFRSTVKQLGIQEQVIYHGWIGPKEIESLFSRIDAYVLPSYAEGMPMSVLEAMAHGLPVVSTNVGGIPDLILHNKTGLLISPGDQIALSREIKRLALEPDLRRKMGKKALERVKEHYQLATMTNLLMNVYNDLSDR